MFSHIFIKSQLSISRTVKGQTNLFETSREFDLSSTVVILCRLFCSRHREFDLSSIRDIKIRLYIVISNLFKTYFSS